MQQFSAVCARKAFDWCVVHVILCFNMTFITISLLNMLVIITGLVAITGSSSLRHGKGE